MVGARSVSVAALLLVLASACSDLNADDDYARAPRAGPEPGATGAVASQRPPDPRIFQPTKRRGGTLRLASVSSWNLDPAAATDADARNFARNYVRTLTVYRSAPPGLAADGRDYGLVVPDLAERPGAPSNAGKTWTYRLREGVKYEDGSSIVADDIVYAVERARNASLFPASSQLLDVVASVRAIDDRTVAFELTRAVTDFDHLAQLPVTAPVPRAKDTGAAYGQQVLASGPYRVKSVTPGQNFVLVRNEQYDRATDPLSERGTLPDAMAVDLSVPTADMTGRLRAGSLDMQVGRLARQTALGDVLTSSEGEVGQPVDTAILPALSYVLLSTTVTPLWNQECRLAVALAADRTALQTAYGGPDVARPATGLLPPIVPGAGAFDVLNLRPSPGGDVVGATAALKRCQTPDGFSSIIGYREGEAAEKAAAESLRQSLARVGIKLQLKAFPAKDYYEKYAGDTEFAKANKIGLVVAGRTASWPDGGELARPVVDGAVRGQAANVDMRNILEAKLLLENQTRSFDPAARNAAWATVDSIAMKYVLLLPSVWGQTSQPRPSRVGNLLINDGFGGYDYTRLGLRQS